MLEWKSNAKHSQKLEKGSIFDLKNNNLNIAIHHYIGCGDNWFLSCHVLGIKAWNLHSTDFNEAVLKAKDIINKKVDDIVKEKDKFVKETENVLVRY